MEGKQRKFGLKKFEVDGHRFETWDILELLGIDVIKKSTFIFGEKFKGHLVQDKNYQGII
ncbi:MAG: hypothetical protein ACPLZD_00105 [Candidatus Saccharicenans sp.]